MQLTDLVNPAVLTQPVYEPGRPIEDVAREMGLNPKDIIKLASNENPLGSSPKAKAAMTAALEQVSRYPDGGSLALSEKLAILHDVSRGQIVLGNGSNELLELLGHLFLKPGDDAVMGQSAFIVYKLVTLMFGANPIEVPLDPKFVHDLGAMKAAVTPRTKLVFIPTPNNPTGTTNSPNELVEWARELPDHVVLVVDEAYGEYLDEISDWSPLIEEGRKLVILRTFSKIYGLAGIRVGYGRTTIELANLLQRVRQPFNVNLIGQVGALAALEDHAWVERCRRSNAEGLQQVTNALDLLGLRYLPSFGNFLLVEVGNGRAIYSELLRQGIIVRPVEIYQLPSWVRITIGSFEENDRLLRALKHWVEGRKSEIGD